MLYDQVTGWNLGLSPKEEHPPHLHERAYEIISNKAPDRCRMKCDGNRVKSLESFFYRGPATAMLIWDEDHLSVLLERRYYYELRPDGPLIRAYVPATQIRFRLKGVVIHPPVAIHHADPFKGVFNPNELKDASVRDLTRLLD